MQDERMNRPTNAPRMDQGGMYQERRNPINPWMLLAALVIVLAVVGFLFRDKLFGGQKAMIGDKTAQTAVKSSGYQAVFLTNGQVYFGKMSDINSMYVTLKDIYYLQVTQPPLQGSQQQGQQTPQAQPQLSLVKLGNELHGPVDEMKINRDQILFYEDMKDDAKVMEAINEYKANPNAGQSQQQSNTPAQQQTPPATTPGTPGANF